MLKTLGPVLFARFQRDKLRRREVEIMDLIVAGKSRQQIAIELPTGVQTVAKHRAQVLRKLNIGNDVELARLALPTGPIIPA